MNDCLDPGSYESESGSFSGRDYIAGIVIGVIFLLIIVIGVIILIIAGVCCGVITFRAKTGRPNNVGTIYPAPVQYSRNAQGQEAVTVGSQVVTVTSPSLTPSQQYAPPVASAPAYPSPGAPPAGAPGETSAQENNKL